jgi:hypothetical protein
MVRGSTFFGRKGGGTSLNFGKQGKKLNYVQFCFFGLARFRLPNNWLKKFSPSSKLITLVIVVVGLALGRGGC